MTHDITEAAFSNEGAWHGLGTVVPRNMEPEEGFTLAGLDWTVDTRPTYIMLGHMTIQEVPNNVALVRSDTGAILGTGSEGYTPFQNSDLLKLCKEIQEIDGSAYLESALQLGGGTDIVLLLRMREWDISGDQQMSYITLWNNHNGSLPLHTYGTDIRVVCRNTLNWSAGSAKGKVKIRHTRGIHDNSKQLVRACEAAREASGSWEDAARNFAGAPVTSDMSRTLMKDAYALMYPRPEPKSGDDARSLAKRLQRWDNGLNSYMRDVTYILGSSTCSTEATAGTAFGAFNAVTEWIDRKAPKVRDRQRAAIELDSKGNERKKELVGAFDLALSISGI